jgi:membrane associated rhomboid family serine protease
MLILPLSKEDQIGFPIFTLLVCLICAAVFVLVGSKSTVLSFAYYPDSINPLYMLTSVFFHGDIFHLLGNLFFFYCFSRTVEIDLTYTKYLVFFAIFVVATNLVYAVVENSNAPTIGISGVVWGFMGVFIMAHPKSRIHCFIWYLWVVKKIEVPSYIFVLSYLAFDIGAYRLQEESSINYVAHFSGFLSGVIAKLFLWPSETAMRRSRLIKPSTGPRYPKR